jgi:putative transposase
VGKTYRMAPTPAAEPVRKARARKRPKGAPTHVRSWPLRPDAAQCRVIRTRFFTGVRVYNAVLGEFIGRSRAVKADPAWQEARRQLPRRTKEERAARRAAFDAVVAAHGFTAGAAQSVASSLRKSWVREHLPAQEAQNLGARAFDASNSGIWAAKAGPGSSRYRVGCIHFRRKTVTVRYARKSMPAAGWSGCSGALGS